MELIGVLRRGLSRTASPAPALPLYLSGLLIGLLQAWPALLAPRAGLGASQLGGLARGDGDGLALLFVGGDPGAIAAASALWVLGALLAAALYAGAYNFFAGGILAGWAAAGPFWASCRRSFWSFTGLGALLLVFAGLSLTLGTIVGTGLGLWAGLAATVALLQLANLLGELARAIVVVDKRRSPARALREAIGVCVRRPGALLIGLLGALLHAALAWLAGQIGGFGLWPGLLLGQLFALLWVWLKLLRLGWALALVELDRAGRAQPVTAVQ